MLRALLRRSLRDWDAALSIELIVAGQNGPWSHRVARDGVVRRGGPGQAGGISTALWYADEVQRAIDSAGQNGGPPARETSLAARILDGAKQQAGAAAQSFEADGRWIYGLSLAQGIAAVVLVETEIPASGLAGW